MVDSVALSALDWWTEAGVDTLVDDFPRDWLAPTAPAIPITPPDQARTAPGYPGSLEAFRAWLLTEAPVPGPRRTCQDALGDPRHGTVIVVDMPEADDHAGGSLLSGDVGALFDRMLSAIDLTRAGIYLIPFSPARPTTGRLSEADSEALAPLLRHHLALAAPRRILLLGDAPVQALLRSPAAGARDAVHAVSIAGSDVPTVASLHPRLVNAKREYRALAWADLQRFAAL